MNNPEFRENKFEKKLSYAESFKAFVHEHPGELKRFLNLDQSLSEEFLQHRPFSSLYAMAKFTKQKSDEIERSQSVYRLLDIKGQETKGKHKVEFPDPVRYYDAYFDDDNWYFIKSAPFEYHSGGAREFAQMHHIQEIIDQGQVPGVRLVRYELGYESPKNTRKYYVAKAEVGMTRLDDYEERMEREHVMERDAGKKVALRERIDAVRRRFEEVKKVLSAAGAGDILKGNCFYDEKTNEFIFFDLNPKENFADAPDEPTHARAHHA